MKNLFVSIIAALTLFVGVPAHAGKLLERLQGASGTCSGTLTVESDARILVWGTFNSAVVTVKATATDNSTRVGSTNTYSAEEWETLTVPRSTIVTCSWTGGDGSTDIWIEIAE